jgi:selenocysteine-specific elongation factor
MIVGTAGHIDHGKTALVHALTGTDTDRLPEEKRRGITIELGYAFMRLPDGQQVGFVDVPGHEKLVRTMVAGASGIDFALLLMAADDGVMPQTMEHATILSLLDAKRGAVVVTKTDRVDAPTLALRLAEARELADAAGLPDYRVVGVSAQRGEGVDGLRAMLAEAARTGREADVPEAGFRMGLDRVFTLDGIGTVVAGSITAGQVHVGDSLCLAHAPDKHWRVRSLRANNQSVSSARRGQRCAVGLAGLEREAVERGQTLCDPAIAQTTHRVDVWLKVAPTEARALRSGTLVHLHLATQELMATVAVLGAAAVEPGESGLCQLVLPDALVAWQGDGFVVRDASAVRTVAGGQVLDTSAPARYRQTPERLAFLQTQRAGSLRERLEGALANAPFGLDGSQWLRSAALKAWPFDIEGHADVVSTADGRWLVSSALLAGTESAVVDALQAFHARLPEDIGPDLQRMRRLAAPRMPESLWQQFVSHLVASGKVMQRNGFLHLAVHGEQLRAAEKAVAERALPLLLEGRFDPPWVRDIALAGRLPEAQVRHVLARLAKTGDVYQVVKDLYYHPRVVNELAALARGIAQSEGSVTAARFRDATGLGRKRAIQILEFFDRIGFLRRVGEAHLLRTGTALFPQEQQAKQVA